MDRNDRERTDEKTPAPASGADGGADGGSVDRHEPGGPGDGMRTGGSAGTGSGHDPMPDEVRRQLAEQPRRGRTKGDGAGTV